MKQAQPWVVGFSVRLEKIIQILGQKFPGGCQIFVANIYDPTDGDGDTTAAELPRWPDVLEILSAYNKVIERVAATHSHVHMVDMHREFLGHGVHCTQFWMPNYRSEDPHYWYGTNLEDPHDRGYDAIRRLFLIEMARVFRGG